MLPLHYFSRLRARGIEAWLVVHARTRDELLEVFPNDRARLIFIEDAWFHKLLFRLSPLLPRRISESSVVLLSQLATQLLARKLIRRLVREQSIDVVHQPIPVSPRSPSLMTRVGAPVVIGPMNGGMDYPPAFRSGESVFTRLFVRLGRQASDVANRIVPGKRNACVLLAANQRTRESLPSCARGEVILLPENGVDLAVWEQRSPNSDTATVPDSTRFVFLGRLVDWKRVDIIIRALGRVPDAQLEIIGDGPMRQRWQALADETGIGSRILFSGWLSQPDSARRLHSARALLLPSVYESGGAVVLEAMAAALPVIAMDWGGPADYLNSHCGILIPPDGYESAVSGFAAAMSDLLRNPQRASELGLYGRNRAEQFYGWEKKIDRILDIYRACLASGHHRLSGQTEH